MRDWERKKTEEGRMKKDNKMEVGKGNEGAGRKKTKKRVSSDGQKKRRGR